MKNLLTSIITLLSIAAFSQKDSIDQVCRKQDSLYDTANVLYISDGFPCDSATLVRRLTGRVIKSITAISPKDSPLPCCYRPCSWLAIIRTYSEKELRKLKRKNKK